jgi:DNA polymerase-3 subunit beta
VELTIARSDLSTSVAAVFRGIATKPTHPALGGIRIDANGSQVTFTGFDGDSLVETNAKASVTVPGIVLVPGISFNAMVRQLEGDKVALTLSGSTLSLSCGAVNVGFPILSIADYPTLPTMPPTAGTIGSDLFADAISSVAGAAERDSQIGALSVVELRFTGSDIAMSSTDKYRLAWRKIDWHAANTGTDKTMVISVRALADAARLAASGPEVSISWSAGSHVGFSTKTSKLIVCAQDTAFPDCSSLIELQPTTRAILAREQLLAALSRAAVFSTEGDPVHLTLDANKLTISVSGNTTGATSSEQQDCQYTGSRIEMYFAAAPLIDALRAIDCDEVKLGYTEDLKPIVLAPKDGGGGTYRHVLMPRRA